MKKEYMLIMNVTRPVRGFLCEQFSSYYWKLRW